MCPRCAGGWPLQENASTVYSNRTTIKNAEMVSFREAIKDNLASCGVGVDRFRGRNRNTAFPRAFVNCIGRPKEPVEVEGEDRRQM